MNQDLAYLEQCIELAKTSRATGNHPFGALLVGPQGEVLLSAGNAHKTEGGPGHAEANVARQAALNYSPEFLENCILVTSVEPCCMCAGAVYWAGIGTVVYGLTEKRLALLTGANPENLTMDLCCETVFAAGQRKVQVRGPYPELEDKIAADHIDFW